MTLGVFPLGFWLVPMFELVMEVEVGNLFIEFIPVVLFLVFRRLKQDYVRSARGTPKFEAFVSKKCGFVRAKGLLELRY